MSSVDFVCSPRVVPIRSWINDESLSSAMAVAAAHCNNGGAQMPPASALKSKRTNANATSANLFANATSTERSVQVYSLCTVSVVLIETIFLEVEFEFYPLAF